MPGGIPTLPPILHKIIGLEGARSKSIGFSMNDIVALGNQMEYANLSTTTVQNWIKRDVKDIIATPQAGKKYSVEQVATIFVIEDLKSSLDFESIRRMLGLIFNDPRSDDDDVIHPVDFLAAYAEVYEKFRTKGLAVADIAHHARTFAEGLADAGAEERRSVAHAITVAVLALQASSFQFAAKTIASSVVIDRRLS
jgi:hypothetical protein